MCYDNYCSLFTSCFNQLCWNMITTASFITLPINRYNNWLLPLLGKYLLILNRVNKLVDHRMVSLSALTNSARIWSIPSDLCLYSFSIAISTQKALGSSTSKFTACVLVFLMSLTICTFSSWEKWFLHLAIILWQCANTSPVSFFTLLVLGW